MGQRTKKAPRETGSRVLGARAFAAISAIEGLKLTAAGKRRLDLMDERKLTPDERRAEVLRAYMVIKERE